MQLGGPHSGRQKSYRQTDSVQVGRNHVVEQTALLYYIFARFVPLDNFASFHFLKMTVSRNTKFCDMGVFSQNNKIHFNEISH
jgi:hypothetical protein